MPTTSGLPSMTSARATLAAGLLACITVLQAAPALAAKPLTKVRVRQPRKASRAAATVAAMSPALCAALTKPASYSAGAR